eukprot:TRINITY_DN2893_c0_g1_i5.p1 TRINITY_DN2893_c0_g1~~TRINITY_DN2893_c0_g1_i5.p1  ORF type:complete len:288 (+),score=58.27 TRINITY_DN2893_c0_g1_i5:714-1577(+)
MDYNFTDVDLEIVYLLLMEAVYRISSPGQLDLYTADNVYIKNYEHNFKNEVMIHSSEIIDAFIKNLDALAYEEKDKMRIISIICLSLYLATVAVQFIFVVLENFSIFSQAELMLLLPPRNCKEQEKIAKDFLMVIHLGTFDVEQMSEDNYSYGSNANSVKSGRKKNSCSTSVSKRNMEGRRFVRGVLSGLGCVWRCLLFLCLLGGYLLVIHFLSLAHFNTLMKIDSVYENTIFFNGYVNGVQNGVMNYYITPDQKVRELPPYEFIHTQLAALFDYANYLLDVLLPNA